MKIWFLEQLAMYAAYHQDHRNQLTHHIGVPMIIFSLLMAASVVIFPLGAGLPLSVLLIAGLMVLFAVNVPLIGAVAILKYGLLTALALNLVADMTINAALIWSLALFIVGWIIQFVGHIFEGRKPALFDNLTQVFMAPAFLIAEGLFLAGLASDLHDDIEERRQKYAKNAAPQDGDTQPAQ